MRPVAPRIGDRANELMIAEEQEQYRTLPAAAVHLEEGIGVLTRWTFTPEERAAIAAGDDIYLTVLTFGQPIQPLRAQVGQEGLGA